MSKQSVTLGQSGQAELSHAQLLETMLAAIDELKQDIGKVSEKVSRVEQTQDAINARLDRIDGRLAAGDKRMTEQDKSLVLQSSVIRTLAQLKAMFNTLDGEISELERLEQDAIGRIHPEHTADPDEITNPAHPRPDPDTMPAPPPDSGRSEA